MTRAEERLLVVTPTGRDAALTCATLEQFHIVSDACATVREACEQAAQGVGGMILAEEALVSGALERLAALIDGQPKWSDIPMILLTSNGDRIHAAGQALLEQKGIRGNLVIVERPVRRLTLRLAAEAALQSRRRQYEMRDHLEEMARQEQRLRHSQKIESIGILAGGIAHDFNNLLTGVLGNASLVLDGMTPGSPEAPLLQRIVDASERAAHLTRQLLAYAGKGRFVVEPLNLSQQVREISALIQTSIPAAVQLRFELAEDLPPVEGDASQLQQVIMNLVINGAEAIPEGQHGSVTVVTATQEVDQEYIRTALMETQIAPGLYATLEVHDSGIGMDEATQARIFDPFFTTKFTGRGLGLAAVMGIVHGHGGALKLYSVAGRGSSFKVLLPVCKSARQAPQGHAVDLAALAGRGCVLVIDDERLVRQVAKATLERFGYTVETCEDGPSGIEAFRKIGDVSVVLLDMSMPTMSGEETFRHLRAIRPDVKVILSSGYNEVEAISRFTGKGLAGFIQKPYTGTRLAETVRRVLLG